MASQPRTIASLKQALISRGNPVVNTRPATSSEIEISNLISKLRPCKATSEGQDGLIARCPNSNKAHAGDDGDQTVTYEELEAVIQLNSLLQSKSTEKTEITQRDAEIEK